MQNTWKRKRKVTNESEKTETMHSTYFSINMCTHTTELSALTRITIYDEFFSQKILLL